MSKGSPASRGNLPAHISSFIGREGELAEISHLLRHHRLVTLTGPGGIGKTRLALRAAAAESDRFEDGVWLVELAALDAPELVVETVAKVLRVPKVREQDLLERLGHALGTRTVLLVLDNCEHMLHMCAHVASYLLTHCPSVVVLATSREPLGLDGEWTLRVPPLTLPPAESIIDPDRLLDHDGVRLFVDRARAAEPSFQLTSVTAPSVAAICRKLDGIPLALELAAMRVRGMGVAHLDARLGDRFRLLTRGAGAGEPRQSTLYATVDWSYNLLSERERTILRRLGVFAGNFSLAAAESVCVDADGTAGGPVSIMSASVLNELTRLVDKSLVQFDQETGLYSLFETIRSYCLQQLEDAGETRYAHRQRFAHYLRLAEEGNVFIGGSGEEAWCAQVELEHDNYRAAFAWAIQAGRTDEATRLALGLWRFWHKRTYQREGFRYLQQLHALDAACPLPGTLRPQLFNALGVMAHATAHFDMALRCQSEAQRLWIAADDQAGITQSSIDLAWLYYDQTWLEEALPQAEKGLALAEHIGEERLVAGALMIRSLILLEGPRISGVIPDLERSLAIWRKREDAESQASNLALLGVAYQRSGDYERSKSLLAESVRIHVRLGSYGELVSSLVGLLFQAGLTAESATEAEDAARIMGALMAWEQRTYSAPSPWWQSEIGQRIRERIVDRAGTEAMARAISEGKRLTTVDILALTDRVTAPAQAASISESPARSRVTLETMHTS